jgi:hypothetical protein
MKEVIDKISSYNFFNYLFPGVLFVVITAELTPYSFVQSDLIIGAFVYYFFGLVISRFGSLFIEPLLKKISFLKFASYPEFVSACNKDIKIEILSEANNMYRTFCSMFILILFLKLYSMVEFKFPVVKSYNPYILIILPLIMFLYSYRKQTKYIFSRIKANNK